MELGLAHGALAAAAAAAGAGFMAWRGWRSRQPLRPPAVPAAVELDPVSGLMTRARFDQALQARIDAAAQPLAGCMLVMGLDAFRLVIDDGGTVLGDQALKQVAVRLRAWGGESALLARVGGDVFALWVELPAIEGERLALRIVQAFASPLPVEGRDLDLGLSVGVAVAPEQGSPLRLIDKAAAAMRVVQRSGGGAHARFDPGIEAAQLDELAVARELQHAVGKGQLELFFQPKVDARKLEVGAVEALLRWRHPQHGLIPPERFVPVAERQGLIEPLGDWVLERALKRAEAWHGAGLRLRVAINLSGAQFRRDDLAARLERALRQHRLAPATLTCEIGEATALENTAATRRAFGRLQRLGVLVSVGGFGVHPDAAAALATLPVHEVKLHRALVVALPTDEAARRNVELIVAAAHARGLRVVAEGVENEAQRNHALRLGCDDVQGFLIAKPMSARAIALWAVDASQHLAQSFRPSQFQPTQIRDTRSAESAFAATMVSRSS